MSRRPVAPFAVLLVALALGSGSAADAATADSAAAPARWLWPTSPPGAILQPYLAPPGPYAAGHRGVDLAAAPGTTVLAPADGTVVFAGVVVDRPVVTIRVSTGVLLSMEPVKAAATVGENVRRGDPVGIAAAGGHCDARCVHLGVRVDGHYISPMLYFATVPAAVLLPLP